MAITLEDFKKLEIKIGTILEAEPVKNSEKLIKLQIDLGNEKRQVLAGITQFYKAEELVGKQIPILVNLEPKKMAGEESNGMMLAVDVDGKPVLLSPSEKIPAGSEVR